ncbi:class I SAM-dependent methyltransferase [Streptomyces sp. NPDC003233]
MSVQQYDTIGEAFEGFKALPLIRYGEVPSFLGMVRDVSGKSVLDLACGTGFYREFKRRGATDVFGVDISVDMIAATREIEQRDPVGVRYEVGDVTELRPLDRRFDIALAVQCLNCAEDIAAMERTCRNIHRTWCPVDGSSDSPRSPTTGSTTRPWTSAGSTGEAVSRREIGGERPAVQAAQGAVGVVLAAADPADLVGAEHG